MNRNEILDAKRHLYYLILKLPNGEWTDDDRRIGMALIADSEIQALLDRALKTEDGK